MLYAKIEKGAVAKYPYAFRDLRRDNPDVSFPRAGMGNIPLAMYGIVEVVSADRPADSPTARVTEGAPQLVRGKWTQTWVVEAVSVPSRAERFDRFVTGSGLTVEDFLAELQARTA